MLAGLGSSMTINGEDRRILVNHAAENETIVRQAALNQLKEESATKLGIKSN